MKKFIVIVLACLTLTALFAACGKENSAIQIITREDGSGTRSAFVELLGITGSDGKDAISTSAETTNSTSVMVTTVAGSKNAIGYISLGSLSNDVKAVSVDGVAASVANIKNGSYRVQRPFNVCYKDGSLSDLATDFLSYIMSAEGQKIISDNGYIAVDENAKAYTVQEGLTGKITLSGSTSVSPVMNKIADAYKKINPNVKIEIQETGSGAGITSATEGTSDIGMSSRDLKTSEAAVLVSKTIAKDGIAVIVNQSNTVTNLTSAQIKDVFLGNTTDWSNLSK